MPNRSRRTSPSAPPSELGRTRRSFWRYFGSPYAPLALDDDTNAPAEMTDVTFDELALVHAHTMTTTTPTVPDRSTEALALLDDWAGEPPQTLVSRNLVIDRLLDLRGLVHGTARSDIDALLADVPGVTVVEGSWWSQLLTRLTTTIDQTKADAHS